VKNEKILYNVKEENNSLHKIRKRKAILDWSLLTYELPSKTRYWRHVEKRVEVTWRGGRRRKQWLDDLKEMRGYWKLEEEALNRTLWRTRFKKILPDCRKHTQWR
jgi:hypothetical protein